LGLVNSSFI